MKTSCPFNEKLKYDIMIIIPKLKKERSVLTNHVFSEKYSFKIDKIILRHSKILNNSDKLNPFINIFSIREINECKKNYANFYREYITDNALENIASSSMGFMGWLTYNTDKSKL